METNASEVYCLSGDSEYFYETECATLEDAITEGLRQYRQACRGNDTDCFPADLACLDIETAEFFVGTKTEFVPTINAVDVIERLQEDAFEECDEWSDGYLDHLSDDDVAVLQNLLQLAFNRWQTALHLEPHFFVVKDASSVRVADHKERLAMLCCCYGSSGTATERLCGDSASNNAAYLPKG